MTRDLLRLSLYWLLLIGIKAIQNDQFYPRYHLAPPEGWMNDPNGFCKFRGEYHLFYQYNPFSSLEPGIAHWGHAVSTDLFHWKHLPIAMYPDHPYDRSGVFSGSALIQNDTLYLYYTGNVNHPGESPDHEQRQALAISIDGVTTKKYRNNPVIMADDRQPNIRDPKVWKHGEDFYMVLGNSFNNNSLGRALLYHSPDGIDWKEVSVLAESDGSLGYMWECPDFFEIDGKFILLFSPQGIEPEGEKYRNLYQTGYIVGNFDYDTLQFVPISKFRELDHGHDFYATQTFKDDEGRRLLVAWFDMWEQDYPERADGWTGQMTIVRELRLSRLNILEQRPVKEIENIREKLIYDGTGGDDVIQLHDKSGEIYIEADVSKPLEVIIESNDGSAKVLIVYDNVSGRIILDRGGHDGIRSTVWRPSRLCQKIFIWKIYVDASSIELFTEEGDVTFSSRFFPRSEVNVHLGRHVTAKRLTIISLKRSVLP